MSVGAPASIIEEAADLSVAEPPQSDHSRQCEKVLALDRAVSCLDRAREQLAAGIWAESDVATNFWIDQLRTARAVFHERITEYREHHEDCAACQAKTEGYPTVDAEARPDES